MRSRYPTSCLSFASRTSRRRAPKCLGSSVTFFSSFKWKNMASIDDDGDDGARCVGESDDGLSGRKLRARRGRRSNREGRCEDEG